MKLCLRDFVLGQSGDTPRVLELVGRLATSNRAHDLEVVDVGLVESLCEEVAAVQGREVLGHIVWQIRPALAVIPTIVGVREGQVLDRVRHVYHPGVQVLVAVSDCQLQVTRDSGHLKPAFRVATFLKGLVVASPTVRLHPDRPLNPSHDLDLSALPIVDGKGSVGLIKPEHWVCVDTLLPANALEVYAVHLDHPHLPWLAITVVEQLCGYIHSLIAVYGEGHLVPLGGKLLTVAAPARKEVDEREIMRLQHMIEALVVEAVVRI
mmetsp:Transcript_71743/g.115836  ORF Transcript_71743/g.115836 Transcript_71743/m.115836 type:complete len:265 (-) Transcript_71743:120-914(-)